MIVIFWMRADRNAGNAVNIKKYAYEFFSITIHYRRKEHSGVEFDVGRLC